MDLFRYAVVAVLEGTKAASFRTISLAGNLFSILSLSACGEGDDKGDTGSPGRHGRRFRAAGSTDPPVDSDDTDRVDTDSFGLEDLQGNLIDILGAYGVNGTNEPWEYTDQCIRRHASVMAPNPVWTASEWVFDGAVSGGAGTPGVHP